jgi:hypothetical protein
MVKGSIFSFWDIILLYVSVFITALLYTFSRSEALFVTRDFGELFSALSLIAVIFVVIKSGFFDGKWKRVLLVLPPPILLLLFVRLFL